MQQIVDHANQSPLTIENISLLANSLANSGDRFDFCSQYPDAADIASTGGPSSLSTILCPLFLRIYGFRVPKLGVPGRPAGVIDVFSQLQGYKSTFSSEKIRKILESSGFANLLAGASLTPRDAELFAYRKKTGAIDIPELAIASLLSKKLAVGLETIGLDVRVAPHGNLGDTWEQARINSQLFVDVAEAVGIKATCFLTDATRPYQPYIGRSEALVALGKIFDGSACSWLEEHSSLCDLMARSLRPSLKKTSVTGARLAQVFHENLECQGASSKAFQMLLDEFSLSPKVEVMAKKDGILNWDVAKIREVVVACQRDATDETVFPDPIGITLYCKSGSTVYCGQPICSIRCQRQFEQASIKSVSSQFCHISSSPGQHGSFEIISNE